MTLTEHSNMFGPNTRYKGAASPEILEIGRNTETGMDVKIHTLSNGARVISLSAHPFKFSDGSECEGQLKNLVDSLTLKREFIAKGAISGMKVNEVKMILDQTQLDLLVQLSSMAEIVILPFPVLTALREQGMRDKFPNCVAFNATRETVRAASPSEKIVDIDNWSY